MFDAYVISAMDCSLSHLSLPPSLSLSLSPAIVGSRFDFCKSLLAGTSVSNLTLFQLVTILTAILDFGNHIDLLIIYIYIVVYIPDSVHLLFEILLYFLCQPNSEISNFSDIIIIKF